MKSKQKKPDFPAALSDLRWRMKHMRTYGGAVPATAGWYAIGHDEQFMGLEVCRTYMYIGETGNLRRRLAQHMPATEKNPKLKEYLADNIERARCWYAVAKQSITKKDLVAVEAKLIARFNPKFNSKGQKGGTK